MIHVSPETEARLFALDQMRRDPKLLARKQRRAERQHQVYFSHPKRAQEHEDFHDQEKSRGLLQGSIIGPTLCYPEPATHELIYRRPDTSAWVGFDFLRPAVFMDRPTVRQVWEGTLAGAHIDEVRENKAEQETPTDIFDHGYVMHTLAKAPRQALELVVLGMLRQTTYLEAYDEVGLAEAYGSGLKQRGLADEPVYQVTPKGNTLVFLDPVKEVAQSPWAFAGRMPGRQA